MDHALIPYTTEKRRDTGVTNVTLGIWLFLASEVMLFGALFSAYALLRTSAADWPGGSTVLGTKDVWFLTWTVLMPTLGIWQASRPKWKSPHFSLLLASAFGAGFLALKGLHYSGMIASGSLPSTNMFLALYFTITAFHAAHVLGGVIATLWVAHGVWRADEALTAGRLKALALYWSFVDIVWFVILGLFYVI